MPVEPENTFLSILEKAHAYLPDKDDEILKRAFEFSRTAHREQLRAGGDPYISHPLAVTDILCDMRMDPTTLASGLLHDVLEDTTVTAGRLKEEFGEEICSLVQGVTKIDILEHQIPEHSRQAENWRKMLIASAQDIRVILLKLADRKHNMETLSALNDEKRRRISEETLTLYAPIAQRLGMYRLKSTLEDLSFKYLEPDLYAELSDKIKQREDAREESAKRCVQKLEFILSAYSLPCRIYTRPKNLYSVYRKMLRQNKPFEEIQDLQGLRAITETVEQCYAILGIIHAKFNPLPDTFTDYIAMPKNNLYQSLHTTVHLSGEDILEIQIRTEEMHRIAEYGVAAHWRYKLNPKEGSGSSAGKDSFESHLDWFKQILEWQGETDSSQEFMQGLKTELEFDQVFVFTPKGDVKKLPVGSTPIDFAYAIHSDIGDRCVGAKVNDKMVRLDHPLMSGDRCQILTRKGQNPHEDWLEHAKTPRARAKIRKYFRENPA